MPTQTYVTIQPTDVIANSRVDINNTNDALRALFDGPTQPSQTTPYMLWADTSTNLLKQRNSANNAWITIMSLGQTNGGLLSKAGGTMTGSLNMGGFTVTNVGLGTGAAAARQQELDLKAPLAGPSFTGDAQVNQDPAGNNSLTRRSWTEGRYVKLAGSTMTGALTLSGNAAADLQAVPRQQLRDFTAFNTSAGHRHTGTDSRKIRGEDLDGSGGTSGQVLVSDGTNVAWGGTVEQMLLRRDLDVSVMNTGTLSFVSYQVIDISSVVSTAAYAGLVRCFSTSLGGLTNIRYRLTGETEDTSGMNRTLGAGGYPNVWEWIPINRPDQTIECKVPGSSGTGNINFQFYATMEAAT